MITILLLGLHKKFPTIITKQVLLSLKRGMDFQLFLAIEKVKCDLQVEGKYHFNELFKFIFINIIL